MKILLDEKLVSIAGELDYSFDEVKELINKIILEYRKMDEKVWYSKEKIKLDDILNEYFDTIDDFGDNAKTTISSLTNYVNTHVDVQNSIRSSIGGSNV